MKTAHDPRHLRRIKIMQELFAWDFAKENQSEQAQTANIIGELPKIDQQIAASAPAWPIEKINKVDLAILRLAVYELTKTDVSEKVIIDEAVELAKSFGSTSSPSFVNGVLGKIIGTDAEFS